MRTEIYIWTDTLNAGRCKVLEHLFIECDTPEQARRIVQQHIRSTPSAYYGHFSIPDYWNQNTRSGFTHAH